MIELARRIGCSESLLSKIENDKVRPSVRVLHKLVQALDTNIGHLLQHDDGDADIVLRHGERLCVQAEGPGLTIENLVPSPGSRLLQASLHILEPGSGSVGVYEHVGEEVGYVLEGTLEMTVGERVFLLHQGDSFCFRSDQPHGYRNPSDATTRIIWFNTPPTF